MAGLYLVFGSGSPSRISNAAERLRFYGEHVEIVHEPQLDCAWVGHDDPNLFGPAYDPDTGVRVFTSGRISWDESDWQRAERLLQFTGGLSNRLVLAKYLGFGIKGVERHSGPALLLIWDPREQMLHLFTDHFGYHPVFLYQPEDFDQAIISTFPDAIAGDPDVSVTRDPVALAEFLSAWRITPPHTYHNEIKYAGAASHWCWDFRKQALNRRTYWQPYQEAPFPDIDAATEELSSAVKDAIHIRTLSRLGPVVCFASGGMDSRAILFAAASPADMIGLNLYDVPNKEAAVTKRLCEAAGIRYLGFGRDNDYYPRWLTEAVRLSGGMWSHEDNHFLGTREMVRDVGARTVMTACTTDWLFKGYGLEMKYRRLFGRNLPLKKFTDDRVRGFLPNYPHAVPEEFAHAVRQRLDECFQGTPSHLKIDRDRLMVEDRRVRPACYAVSVSGQLMYRAFPYDTFLADTRIADCYARCRAEWKLNADLWGRVVRRICVHGWQVEDANFGWRVGSSPGAKLVIFGIGWLNRRINARISKGDGLATDGSWPNLGWYFRHSRTLHDLWHSTPPDTRELIAAAWGGNPWSKPVEEWANGANDAFRILTVASHLNQR